MFKVNSYFDGKVTSLAFQSASGDTTTGVIAPGEYEFNTSRGEHMVITSGSAQVLLRGAIDWTAQPAGSTFDVPAASSFRIRVTSDTTYLCYFQ